MDQDWIVEVIYASPYVAAGAFDSIPVSQAPFFMTPVLEVPVACSTMICPVLPWETVLILSATSSALFASSFIAEESLPLFLSHENVRYKIPITPARS